MKRPELMAILNVTPDSFSDGGQHFCAAKAIDSAIQMVQDGADVIDVGGESTRPGAEPVSLEDELHRVVPVIKELCAAGIKVSVDTMKAEVARVAISEGAWMVNDVTAGSDPDMLPLCASKGVSLCLMHMQGTPKTMQVAPKYVDVVAEVLQHLTERARLAEQLGLSKNKIWIDPGIGFGKTLEHNLQLLARIPEFVATGYDVLIGVSRKGFIGQVLANESGPLPMADRLEGTLAVQVLAQSWGARMIRCHDVKSARRAIDMAAAVLSLGS